MWSGISIKMTDGIRCGTDCRGRTSDRGSKADHGGLRQILMSQVDEADMKHLISYLDNIYHIAEKEIEARKGQGRRKEREHE